jgi:hypothetical protein
MLKTHKAGVKTKASGLATQHLHSGLLGHRLTADSLHSKTFAQVVTENNLKVLPAWQIGTFHNADTIESLLRGKGPIMVGGNIGQIFSGLLKHLGHWVVVAGVRDTTGHTELWVHDPWHTQPHWQNALAFQNLAWFDGDSQIVNA